MLMDISILKKKSERDFEALNIVITASGLLVKDVNDFRKRIEILEKAAKQEV